MKKCSIIAVFLLISCMSYALTPPATPGENVWDLVARAGSELDQEIEFGASLAEGIESKIDKAGLDLEGVASCCDFLQTVEFSAAESALDTLISGVELPLSVIEVVALDLATIESKIDAVPGAVEQSLADEFQTTISLLENVESTVDVVASKVDVLDSDIDVVGSSVQGVTSEVAVIASKLDKLVADTSGLDGCCEAIDLGFSRVESVIDEISLGMSEVGSVLDALVTDDLPRIQSKVDGIEANVSTTDSVYDVVESQVVVVESKVDAFGGSLPSGSPCNATTISQADFIAGIYTISVSGSYCLAQDVTGTISITSSDVTLDLNDHVVNLSGTDSISVAAGTARITVRNGRLRNRVTILGSDIVFEYIQLEGPSSDGYGFVVGGGASPAKRITINHCMMRGFDYAIRITDNVSGVYILNTMIDSTGGRNGIDIVSNTSSIDTVLIKDCELTGGSRYGIYVNVATTFAVSDIQILNTIISNYSSIGVYLDGDYINKVLIKNCSFENNRYGVYFYPYSFGLQEDIVVVHNTFMAGSSYCMYLSDINNFNISYNTVSNFTGRGIFIRNCANGDVSYNSVVACDYGIYLQTCTNVAIEHNDLVNNTTANLIWTSATAPQYNTIVANKAYASSGTSSFNYTDPLQIPTLESSRAGGTITVLSGGTAPTAWHNWSSIP